jgi:hypothetical protein
MWLNGMMNAENPLAHEGLDDTPDDLQFYGYDPNGPSPFEDSDNNVVVSPIYHNETTAEILTILQTVDPLRPSTEMGINVYLDALGLVENMLREQTEWTGMLENR